MAYTLVDVDSAAGAEVDRGAGAQSTACWRCAICRCADERGMSDELAELPRARSTRSTTRSSGLISRARRPRARASASSRARHRSTGRSARRRCCAACAAPIPARCRARRCRAIYRRNHVGLPRAGAAAGGGLSRPRGHVQRNGDAQAVRRRRASAMPCASIDEVFRQVETGAVRLRRGAGGELHRRRDRPHARSAAHHAAEDLRRSGAARAPEPACPSARRPPT